MGYLLLSILSSALIANLLFIFQKIGKIKIQQIFLGNYILASLFSFWMNDTPIHNIRFFDLILGIITGFLFLYNFVLYKKNISLNGLSLSVGTMRISLIIPIFVGLILFKEKIFIMNYFGIVLIFIAFIFITNIASFRNMFWLLILFFITGATESMLKVYDVFGLPEKGFFIFLIFASALLFNSFWILSLRQKIHWRSIGLGLILGIPNQLTTKFLIKGLETVPAAIAFPFTSSSVVVITILTELLFWKKRFSFKQKIALILMIAGIALLNLKR